MVVDKVVVKPKILGKLFYDLLMLFFFTCYIYLCLTDDKYAAEVKEYDSKTSNGISFKVKTPPPSPAEQSDKTDKSKLNIGNS